MRSRNSDIHRHASESSIVNRRDWMASVAQLSVALGLGTSAAGALAACARVGVAQQSDLVNQPADRSLGRLQSAYHRPVPRTPAVAADDTITGEAPLQLGAPRDGLRYVPAGYNRSVPVPLVLMLHGANGQPAGGMRPFRALADGAGLMLLAPSSRAASWDVRYGSFGPDVKFIDAALDETFRRYNVDQSRIFIVGFSDGASYALSLGLSNGSLFKRVVAFSPGFFEPGALQGEPPIFISHGTQDQILNIDASSRRLVPELRKRGYDVTYQEFTGPHTVPPEIAVQAKDWLQRR